MTAQPGDTLCPDYSITDAYWVLTTGEWCVTRLVARIPQILFKANRPGNCTGGIPIIDVIAPPMVEMLHPFRGPESAEQHV